MAGRIPGISVKISRRLRQFSRTAIFRSFSLFVANSAGTVPNLWELELVGFPGSVFLPPTMKKSNELLFPSKNNKNRKIPSSSCLDLLTSYVSVLWSSLESSLDEGRWLDFNASATIEGKIKDAGHWAGLSPDLANVESCIINKQYISALRRGKPTHSFL